jgi:hypothetical protein
MGTLSRNSFRNRLDEVEKVGKMLSAGWYDWDARSA